MDKITEFWGEFRFLSNFWPAEVQLDGVTYPTVEHAFQAAKTLSEQDRHVIMLLKEPADAKCFGRTVHLRDGWDDMKVDIMRGLLRQKFSKEPLRTQLLNTGHAELIEGNWWRDNFWGVFKGVGKNHLGKLLMDIRNELTTE